MASAVARGASCVSELYQSFGCKPVCGKCVPYVRENLLQVSISDSATS